MPCHVGKPGSPAHEDWATKRFHPRTVEDLVHGGERELYLYDGFDRSPRAADAPESNLLHISRTLPDPRGGLRGAGESEECARARRRWRAGGGARRSCLPSTPHRLLPLLLPHRCRRRARLRKADALDHPEQAEGRGPRKVLTTLAARAAGVQQRAARDFLGRSGFNIGAVRKARAGMGQQIGYWITEKATSLEKKAAGSVSAHDHATPARRTA